MEALPRLIFLAEEHRPLLPKFVADLIPHGGLVGDIASRGMMVAVTNSDLPAEVVNNFYDLGRKPIGGKHPDRGSSEEFRYTAGRLALDALELDRDNLDMETYLGRIAELRDWVVYGSDELVGTDDVSFTAGDGQEVPKFMSGFGPFDAVTGGFYQGIVTIQGKPGHGKTSIMLAFLEALRKNNVITSSIFLEVEIPRDMMLYKVRPMKARTAFTEKDRLLTGSYTTRQLLRRLVEDPDPGRAIFIDGPDAMTTASGDTKRFALEALYRDLVRIKNASKIVVASSQPRRGVETLDLETLAESASKERYSDIVLGIHRKAPVYGNGDRHQVMVNCVKNRFGPAGGEVSFEFDYTTMTYTTSNLPNPDDWSFNFAKSSGVSPLFQEGD